MKPTFIKNVGTFSEKILEKASRKMLEKTFRKMLTIKCWNIYKMLTKNY
jgi:hypothetical protein